MPGEKNENTESEKSETSTGPGLSLERIIDLTGEMVHLNELVCCHLERSGGFTTQENYFSVVHPLLDRLESEIRCRYLPGVDVTELKEIVHSWIEHELAAEKRE